MADNGDNAYARRTSLITLEDYMLRDDDNTAGADDAANASAAFPTGTSGGGTGGGAPGYSGLLPPTGAGLSSGSNFDMAAATHRTTFAGGQSTMAGFHTTAMHSTATNTVTGNGNDFTSGMTPNFTGGQTANFFGAGQMAFAGDQSAAAFAGQTAANFADSQANAPAAGYGYANTYSNANSGNGYAYYNNGNGGSGGAPPPVVQHITYNYNYYCGEHCDSKSGSSWTSSSAKRSKPMSREEEEKMKETVGDVVSKAKAANINVSRGANLDAVRHICADDLARLLFTTIDETGRRSMIKGYADDLTNPQIVAQRNMAKQIENELAKRFAAFKAYQQNKKAGKGKDNDKGKGKGKGKGKDKDKDKAKGKK